MKERRTYLRSFQILRAIAFLMLFKYHIDLQGASLWGVCFFFVLSGFLDAYLRYEAPPESDVRSSIGFAIRRVSRLYPLHAVMTFAALVLYVAGHWSEIVSSLPEAALQGLVKLFSNLLLISDLFPSVGRLWPYFSEYNIPSWFLSACFIMYLFAPAILRLMRRIYEPAATDRPRGKDASVAGGETRCDENHGAYLKPVIVMAVIYAVVTVLNLINYRIFGRDVAYWFNYESPLSRAGDYIIGMQLGYLFLKISGKVCKKKAYIACGIMAALNILSFAACYLMDAEHVWLCESGFYFTIPVGGLVLCVALAEYVRRASESMQTDHMLLKPVYALGMISPYAYLIHVPVINGIHGIYERITEVNNVVWIVSSFVLTMVLAVITDRLISKRGSADRT